MDYILEADILTYQYELDILNSTLNEEVNIKETFKRILNTIIEKIKKLIKFTKDFIDKHIKPAIVKMKNRLSEIKKKNIGKKFLHNKKVQLKTNIEFSQLNSGILEFAKELNKKSVDLSFSTLIFTSNANKCKSEEEIDKCIQEFKEKENKYLRFINSSGYGKNSTDYQDLNKHIKSKTVNYFDINDYKNYSKLADEASVLVLNIDSSMEDFNLRNENITNWIDKWTKPNETRTFLAKVSNILYANINQIRNCFTISYAIAKKQYDLVMRNLKTMEEHLPDDISYNDIFSDD